MPRKPKQPSQPAKPAAERQFVDREEFIAPVHTALKEPPRTKPLVLVYYGGAGIGKSRLRRELAKQMAADPGVLAATLDFHIPSYRQPEAALLFLRNSISEAYQARFPSFDIAYAVYWQKTHPDTALSSVDSRQETADRADPGSKEGMEKQGGSEIACLLEAGSLLSQLLDESGKLPLIGLVPKVSALVDSRQQAVDREWWTERGERELEDLPQMEPGAIVERLPALWAADVKDYLRSGSPESRVQSPEVGMRRAVLFVDSYEMLGGTEDRGQETVDSRQKTDEWVRELVKQLPEALWVICGRQKLRWEDVEKDWGDSLSQHQLGALPDPAARKFLESCDIPTGQIQDAIVKGSQGVPHYLDLAVDTIHSSRSQVPGSEFQGDSPEVLVEQFTQHLDKPEAETLKVLSAARFWYYGLFEHLITQYQTGYPLAGYDDLARFSFIKDGATPGTQTMHELMREALQDAQSPELRKRVHLYLHELYAKELEGLDFRGITEKHRTAFVEAFYHGMQAMSTTEFWPWFRAAGGLFHDAGQYRLLVSLLREAVEWLEARLGDSHPYVADFVYKLANQLDASGEYDEAESQYRRALAIAEGEHGTDDYLAVECLASLAELLRQRGRYEEAEPLSRRVLELYDRSGRPAMDMEKALGNLAAVLTDLQKYAEAEGLYRRAIAICEKEVEPDHLALGWTLNNLAALLLRQQQRLREAEPLARRALTLLEESLGVNHPGLGFPLRVLAKTVCGLGRYDEAEPLARRALKLCEENLGPEHPSTAVSAYYLGSVLSDQHRFTEAEPLLRRALATCETKLGPDHPRSILMTHSLIGTLAELGKCAEAGQMAQSLLADREKKRGPDHPETADALHAAGTSYLFQGRHAEAGSYFRRALDIRTKALGPEHPGTLASLEFSARAEANQGNYAEAERLYLDVLAKRERVLGPDHPIVAETANRLAGLCARGGRYEEAESLFRRALAIREKRFGPDHAFVADTLEGLAKVYEQTGRAAEAQGLSARAKRIRAQTQGAP